MRNGDDGVGEGSMDVNVRTMVREDVHRPLSHAVSPLWVEKAESVRCCCSLLLFAVLAQPSRSLSGHSAGK